MRRWMTLLVPGLTLANAALAEEPRTLRELGHFEIRTVDGALQSETVGDRGVLSVQGKTVAQTLSWEPAVGRLAAIAHHELDLIVESARVTRGRLQTDGFVHSDRVGGQEALRWTARVDDTWFLGTATDCPRARVVLVTFGRSESVVQRIHTHALDSLVCARR